MLLFVFLFMLLSFWVSVTKNGTQDTTIPMWVGYSLPNTTETIVHNIVNGETSNSQHNNNEINQASELTPFFSKDFVTTEEESNDGFTTVTSSSTDKLTDSSGMTKDILNEFQLETLGDPTAMPTTWSPYVVRTVVVLFPLMMP